jgi:hypothetical protein
MAGLSAKTLICVHGPSQAQAAEASPKRLSSCKPNKLTAAVKAERRENRRRWLSHEQAAGWTPR